MGTARGEVAGARGVVDLSVGFVLQPAFTLLSFSCFVDALRHAADEGDGSRQRLCRWAVLGDPTRPVAASCGVSIRPDAPLGEAALEGLDYLAIVGGLIAEGRGIDPAIHDVLASARRAGVGLVSLCTGFFHLARAGLLDGKRCCVPFIYQRHVTEEHPSVEPVTGPAYVEDDGIFTALGGIAALELALDLIERHCGPRRSRKCADRLCIDATFEPRRALTRAADGFDLNGNRYLERAGEIMRERIGGSLDVPALARLVGTSDRNLRAIFHRHTGRSPARLWREMRLQEARWRLANSSQSITRIAHATGFADSAHLTRSFKALFGETPSRYRALRLQADGVRPS